MKKLLASAAAVALVGSAATAQVVLVPQGQGPGGQQQFILVPVPQDQVAPQQGGAQPGANLQPGQQQMRARAESMALDLYRRGYQRGMADAQSAAGPALDPAAMEQIGRELFERGYMLGLMQAQAQMAQQTTAPGGDQQAQAGQAGQQQGSQATAESVAQSAQGQATATAEPVAAEGPQVVIGSAESQEFGVYLTDDTGRPVYMLEADQQGAGEDAQAKSTCYGKCAEVWPPVTSPVKPLAEDLANEEELERIERENGGMQVTYNGWPLYYYTRDEGAEQPAGHDVHDEWGEWYLLRPSGEKVGEN